MSEFKRRNYGRGHAYYLGDRKLDGVTTLISNGLPKPALVNWAARTAAEKAVNEWDRLAELPVAQRLREIAKGPDDARNSAAVKGTRIHALADPLAHGAEVDVPDELAGHVESCVRFLDEWHPKIIVSEAPVYHEKYLYAGTLDLLAEIGDETWLLDWKTSASGAYGDTAFQLAAYRYATHMLAGNELIEMPPVDRCGVVWLRADGYDLYHYDAGPDVWRQFLYVQQVAKAAAMSRDYKGDALTAPARSRREQVPF
jgi:hypothetical protein